MLKVTSSYFSNEVFPALLDIKEDGVDIKDSNKKKVLDLYKKSGARPTEVKYVDDNWQEVVKLMRTARKVVIGSRTFASTSYSRRQRMIEDALRSIGADFVEKARNDPAVRADLATKVAAIVNMNQGEVLSILDTLMHQGGGY